MSATEFTRELRRAQVDFDLISHRHTESAYAEALEVGLLEVAKTIVVTTNRGYVRAVLPAGKLLDLQKLRALLGAGKEIRLASEEELAGAYPMFELGAVPPFGGPTGDRAVLDRSLAVRESIVLEAGSHAK